MKKCSICYREKELNQYKKGKMSKKTGEWLRSSFCNECRKDKYKERVKLSNKLYYQKNKEKLYKKNREWAEKDIEAYKKYLRDYYENNKEERKLKAKEYREKESSKIKRNINHKNRIKNDSLYRLSCRIKGLIRVAIKRKGLKKNTKTANILGCTFEEFKKYIESKFEPWMNWDNYGLYNGELNYGWDIDHIIPISSVEKEEDIIRLNHYTNLQPLCSYFNRYIKKNNI